ncbi:hypothetical protein P0209_24010, partial [Escherichia coli]
DRNRSHWSTSKTPSYTKSVSWQHHLYDVKAQLAHASIQSTERYAKLTPERMRQTGQGVTDLLLNTVTAGNNDDFSTP